MDLLTSEEEVNEKKFCSTLAKVSVFKKKRKKQMKILFEGQGMKQFWSQEKAKKLRYVKIVSDLGELIIGFLWRLGVAERPNANH